MHRVAWKPIASNFNTPSARIRCLNIIRNFRSDTIALELFDDADFVQKYDAAIFSKKTTDENLSQAKALKDAGKIVIFDICDNQFFDRVKASGTNAEQERRLREMFSHADHITTTTDTLKAVLEQYAPANKITIIEDALEETLFVPDDSLVKRIRRNIDLALYKRWLKKNAEGKTRLIWFGTIGDKHLGTGIFDILGRKDFLEQERYRNEIVLTVCSNGKKIFRDNFKGWKIPLTFVHWNAATFYDVLKLNHVALIPVTPNPLTLCKSNNRVLTALHNNLAVIADEIPSYREFANCIALNDWEKGMERYLGKPENRLRDVTEGRNILQEKYTIHHITQRWENYFSGILRDRQPGKKTA